MSKAESADDCIKCMIRKWEVLYVSPMIFDRGVQSLRQFDKTWRQTDAHGGCATTGSFRRNRTSPSPYIEHTCTRFQMHLSKMRVGSYSSHFRKKCVIALCQGIMASAFEGPE